MKTRNVTLCTVLTAILLSPALAFGDMGSPLVIARDLHLVFGNLLIGIGEGGLLAMLFRRNILLCMPIMIAANYFSACIGAAIDPDWISRTLQLDLYNARRWFWILVVVTYLLTIVLEWPFVAFCFFRADRWFHKSVVASLIVQSASYVVIFGWYWCASTTSLYQGLTVVQPSQICLPENATVYYIGADDNAAYAVIPGRSAAKKIDELESVGRAERLFARESKTSPGHWDLVASNDIDERCEGITHIIISDSTSEVAKLPKSTDSGGVLQFAAGNRSDWRFEDTSWAGIFGENSKDDRSLFLTLDTPFARWFSQSATQLPSGQLVFQLGQNQICIVDPVNGKIAMLGRGRSPLVAIEPAPRR